MISLHLGTKIPAEVSQPSHGTAGLVRLFDVLVSLALLLVLLPLMLVLATLVKWDSAGSVFSRQERLGLDGKPFHMLKFRTMRADAEAARPGYRGATNQGGTGIGGYLRRTQLDELPQLWNVLTGDMALIGPRPERQQITDRLSAYIPHFRSRLLVKPGLTGWAQVHLPPGASIEDSRAELAYDLYYVQNRGLPMTFSILVRTIAVMIVTIGR